MTRRRTLGDNPLDTLIPRPKPAAGPSEGPGESATPPAPAAEPPPGDPGPSSLPEPDARGPEDAAASDAGPSPENVVATPGQYLTFVLAGQEHAIDILRAREILQYEAVTRVPTTPPWIRGVMNLRGGVVPVVDLAVKFGLPATRVTKRTCIIVVDVRLQDEAAVMGLLADSVSQVVSLAEADIEPPPAFGTRVRASFLDGIGRQAEELALILGIDRLLSEEELLAESASLGEDSSKMQSGESAS